MSDFESVREKAEVIYREYRDDGWPFCPNCGMDELFSVDKIPTIDNIIGCYSCGWRSLVGKGLTNFYD